MAENDKQMPNILWICTDQQRYDTIRALGNDYINTPNLDKLCSEGTAFINTYCQSPVCSPSRSSFLTGLYPSTVHENINGNEYFPNHFKLVTRRLADIGYDCGLIGKLHIASAFKGVENRTDDGYRVFLHSLSPGQGIGNGNQYIDWLLAKGIDLKDIFVTDDEHDYYWYSAHAPAELRQTVWCAEKAVEFIHQDRTSPWLLSVNIYDPHHPFDAPKNYTDRFDMDHLPPPIFSESDIEIQKQLKKAYHQTRIPKKPDRTSKEIKASYYSMIEIIDEQVGRIINALEETGQRENTMILFASDHGEMLGDHGLTYKGCRFYEGAVHVPLIISWKEHFGEGHICDELVELTDIVPTLADICSFPLEITHGKSLLPILRGDTYKEKHREFVRCEYYNALEDNENEELTYATMYFDGIFKLVVYHGMQYGELYNLEEDPSESNNLWNSEAYINIKSDLIKKSFDSSMLIMDPGPPRVGRY